jgi:hypothetical protein
MTKTDIGNDWPVRPSAFPDLMTPVEAAMFLRLDIAGHNLISAYRQERADVGQLGEWFGRRRSIPVALGPVSGGLCCRDLDDEAACGSSASNYTGWIISCGVATSGPSHGLVICRSSGRKSSRPYGANLRQRREVKDA